MESTNRPPPDTSPQPDSLPSHASTSSPPLPPPPSSSITAHPKLPSTYPPPPSDPSAYETHHVHTVYQHIASHFSSTRYKPWPIVSSFLLSLPPGSVGLDLGTGNGKYLPVNPDIFIIASDYSSNLLRIAKEGHKRQDAVVVADVLALPHGGVGEGGGLEGRFDFAISIAVIHHLSTPKRRVEAIKDILRCLRPDGGQALIYVWALEQKTSRRGWDEGGEQDVMVPWVMKRAKRMVKSKASSSAGARAGIESANGDEEEGEEGKTGGEDEEANEETFQRYYHLYRSGELEEDIRSAGGKVVKSGYEKDNWWAVAERG